MKNVLFHKNLFEVLCKEVLVLFAFMTLAFISEGIMERDSIKDVLLWFTDEDCRALWEVMSFITLAGTVIIRVTWAFVTTFISRSLYKR